QPVLRIVRLGLGVVGGLDVRLEEAGIGDGLAGGREVGLLTRLGDRPDAHRHRESDSVGHLGGDGAPPDQLVELELLSGEFVGYLTRSAERVSGWADRLVGLLDVLGLTGIGTRLRRYEPVAEEIGDLGTSS